MRDLPVDENYYVKVLANFEQFCDGFETAAAQRFSGVDNDSRQPIEHTAVESVTPPVVREINELGEEDILARATSIDVQATEVPESSEDI